MIFSRRSIDILNNAPARSTSTSSSSQEIIGARAEPSVLFGAGMAAKASSAFMVRFFSLVVVLAVAVCSPAAAPLGRRYRVGGPEGWRVPPPEDKEMYYVKWASPITFFVEDSIEFVYKNDTVIKVSKAGYYHCNETAGIGAGPVPRDGSTLFLLDTPGFNYFASADLDHCNKGERLIINVLAAAPPAPSSSSSPAQAPMAAPLSQPPSLAPSPAASMDYASAAVGLFSAASFTHAVVLSAAAIALACLI